MRQLKLRSNLLGFTSLPLRSALESEEILQYVYPNYPYLYTNHNIQSLPFFTLRLPQHHACTPTLRSTDFHVLQPPSILFSPLNLIRVVRCSLIVLVRLAIRRVLRPHRPVFRKQLRELRVRYERVILTIQSAPSSIMTPEIPRRAWTSWNSGYSAYQHNQTQETLSR